jgi:hypothetical protein
MPELKDVVDTTETGTTTTVPEAAVTTTAPTATTQVVDATIVEASETVAIPEAPVAKKVKKAKTEKKPKAEKTEGEAEEKLRRPPMEQIVRDFEEHLLDLEVAGQKVKKLGYKCGKIIFGLENTDGGKDFRVIAFKARKKTKSVAGKSRCIFYFGLSKDAKVKELPGVKHSKFGKCSVQSDKPVELMLDKTTFTEIFAQDADKVMDTLKKLAAITTEHKTEAFTEKAAKLEEKTAAKKAKAESKLKSKEKKTTSKKSD